jgi:hypothetical protein
LQRALRDPYRLTALDYALTGVYHGRWLAPHAVLGWMLLRHPDRVPRIAGRLAGVYHLRTITRAAQPRGRHGSLGATGLPAFTVSTSASTTSPT